MTNQKLTMWQNSKTKNVTTQKIQMWQLKKSKSDETKKNQIVTKLISLDCDKTQTKIFVTQKLIVTKTQTKIFTTLKLKLQQNSKN